MRWQISGCRMVAGANAPAAAISCGLLRAVGGGGGAGPGPAGAGGAGAGCGGVAPAALVPSGAAHACAGDLQIRHVHGFNRLWEELLPQDRGCGTDEHRGGAKQSALQLQCPLFHIFLVAL